MEAHAGSRCGRNHSSKHHKSSSSTVVVADAVERGNVGYFLGLEHKQDLPMDLSVRAESRSSVTVEDLNERDSPEPYIAVAEVDLGMWRGVPWPFRKVDELWGNYFAASGEFGLSHCRT